jgi:hypothetical protein
VPHGSNAIGLDGKFAQMSHFDNSFLPSPGEENTEISDYANCEVATNMNAIACPVFTGFPKVLVNFGNRVILPSVPIDACAGLEF